MVFSTEICSKDQGMAASDQLCEMKQRWPMVAPVMGKHPAGVSWAPILLAVPLRQVSVSCLSIKYLVAI